MKTALITDPTTEPSYTSDRESDAHTALTRGLAEYLESLEVVNASGKRIALKRAFDTWAEPEDLANYPSAIVYSPERGAYDASGFAPDAAPFPQTPDGITLVKGGEQVLMLHVDIYSNDPSERMALVQMVEDGLLPVDWMYGARLALPHYFGAHAEFALEACTYMDDAEHARERIRIAHLEVSAAVARLRPMRMPESKTRVSVGVSSDHADPSPKRKGVLVAR